MKRHVLIPSRNHANLDVLIPQLDQQRAYFDELIVAWNGLGKRPDSIPTHGCGLHEMWNLGLGTDGDIALLNDDILIGDDFIENLFRGLYLHERIPVVCGNYDAIAGTGVVATVGITGGLYGDHIPRFGGFAMALRRDWIVSSGYRFPTEMKWWCGDIDLHHTVRAQGLWPGLALDAMLTHEFHRATDWYGEFGEQVARDVATYKRKWGIE